MTTNIVPVHRLASWIEKNYKHALWTVDGENLFERTINLPCDSKTLASALKSQKKNVLLEPQDVLLLDQAPEGNKEIEIAVRWESAPEDVWLISQIQLED